MSITKKDIVLKIEELESLGKFDEHVTPVNMDTSIPVTKDFHYIKKGFFERFKFFLEKIFIVKPFILYINKIGYKSTIKGRENLKGIKKAILTCNHVNIFDCLVVKHGAKHHNVYIVGAKFNNQNTFLGEMMRAGGMLPLSDEHAAMRNFNDAIEKLINKNNYILFYPEQAMWYNYEKVRPFKDGAFHYAVKHMVPIIPMFITFIPTKKYDKDGVIIKKYVLNILQPIYPKNNLSKKDNIKYLREKDYMACKEKYEEFYQKEMKYNIKEEVK